MGTSADLAAVVSWRVENFGGRLLLNFIPFFAMTYIPPLLCLNGSAQQRSAARCASSSVLAVVTKVMSMPRVLVDLVVLDLGEDQLLLDAEGIVAAAVEGVRPLMPRKSRTRGSAVEQRSTNSHILSPRRVTFAPMGMPSRSLKFATDFFALKQPGFWPVIAAGRS